MLHRIVPDWINSRGLWRVLLAVTVLLLFANLLSPAGNIISSYGSGSAQNNKTIEGLPCPEEVDWSQYAYCQYVTTESYLCNSMMIFDSLRSLDTRAQMVMMYPEDWAFGNDTDGNSTEAGRLLRTAEDWGVQLKPISVQHLNGDSTWADSFTKLLAFNQTEYKRVLSLDSDATVLQTMDELFLLPAAPVAMPRAYWMNDHPNFLSSQVVLVEPSEIEFHRIQDAFEHRQATDFDMEIVNDLYGETCFVIPHRRYDLLTGEFKETDHSRYLGSQDEDWDAERVMNETKFIHFSDWPFPKPWIHATLEQLEAGALSCSTLRSGEQDCRNRDMWLWVYEDFQKRRAQVCGEAFM